MRVLVYPAIMTLGGSQINAVDLAARVRDLGHHVELFCSDGVLLDRVRALGLAYTLARVDARMRPDPRNSAQLARVVRASRIDVVHAYEWGPSVDATFGPHLRHRVPVLTTVMSMEVPDPIPTHQPLIVGTDELRVRQLDRRGDVHLMTPPVDTAENAPSATTVDRGAWAEPDELLLAVVCRMVDDLGKASGVLEAVEAVGRLTADGRRVKLVVVGDGQRWADVDAAARQVNSARGREVITTTGAMADPREVYDVADVVLGMGGSAIRGLAFGKPLVVQGVDGYWRRFDEESAPVFARQGFWGARGGGTADLLRELEPLLGDEGADRRAGLGAFSRATAVEGYSLEGAATRLVGMYADLLARRSRPGASALSIARVGWDLAKLEVWLAVHGGRRAESAHA